MQTLKGKLTIMDIERKLLDLLVRETEKTEEEIKSAKIWGDLDMDSLLTMDVILNVEDLFDINIDEKQVEFIKNYADLVKYLKENL